MVIALFLRFFCNFRGIKFQGQAFFAPSKPSAMGLEGFEGAKNAFGCQTDPLGPPHSAAAARSRRPLRFEAF
jgi:hypothetical protein